MSEASRFQRRCPNGIPDDLPEWVNANPKQYRRATLHLNDGFTIEEIALGDGVGTKRVERGILQVVMEMERGDLPGGYALRALIGARISLDQTFGMTDEQLLRLRGFGDSALRDLRRWQKRNPKNPIGY